jgi:hypothetical protein
MQANRTRTTAVFRHPVLGDFEVWHAHAFPGLLKIFCITAGKFSAPDVHLTHVIVSSSFPDS